ncbi:MULTISPECIES: hypothetical protein [Pseudomonas]|uniref:hypothetical protein n=1 Tax=Pseudomonas nitroreducens TaxID=46680 RepID=UPI001E5DA1C9|nr:MULTISPECIES: hypothetical protein [Pseudomonas]MCE4073500.1 hypothetical protein [Pseudomonas nitritireducens]MCE4079739.1 hypothetical protein [Pseudomonas nitroreducens]
MTEKQGCTFCGADGHLAAQCQWAPAIAADIYAKLSSYGALRTSVDNILDVMEAIREVELGHRAYVSADEALVNAEYDLSFARCSNDLPTAKRNVRNAQMSLIALRSLIQCDRPHSPRGASDVAESRFEAPVEGWGDPAPPEPPVECPHRCGSVYVKDSYGAGFIEGSGMCPACDAAMPAKDIVRPLESEVTHVPDAVFESEFMTWWEEHGQYCRSGGGDYERTFAFQAWRYLYPKLMQAGADVERVCEKARSFEQAALTASRIQGDTIARLRRERDQALAGQLPQAWLDVHAERRRQVEEEIWTPEHDDEHDDGRIADEAAYYLLKGQQAHTRDWCWKHKHPDSPKRVSRRRQLVIGVALGLAEIERLDRASARELGGSADDSRND